MRIRCRSIRSAASVNDLEQAGLRKTRLLVESSLDLRTFRMLAVTCLEMPLYSSLPALLLLAGDNSSAGGDLEAAVATGASISLSAVRPMAELGVVGSDELGSLGAALRRSCPIVL